MGIVTVRARQRLSALNEALRIAKRHHLARNKQFFRKGIGPVRKSDVTPGAGIQAPIGGELLRIDHGGAGFALTDRFHVPETRSMAALTLNSALLARPWCAGFAVTCERSEEHTSELQSLRHLVCRLLLEKKHTPDLN